MMKKFVLLALCVFLLTGCGGEPVFETVDDVVVSQIQELPKEIQVQLPEDTVLPVMETDSDMLYMCRDFDVSVQTLNGGDLSASIRQITGREAAELTLVQTMEDGLNCYEFVWSAASEDCEQVCRGKLLDDGNYHYVVTAMADASLAGEYQEIWNGMFETVTLN